MATQVYNHPEYNRDSDCKKTEYITLFETKTQRFVPNQKKIFKGNLSP